MSKTVSLIIMAYAFVSMVSLPVVYMAAYKLNSENAMLADLSKTYRTLHDYYFSGANNRGLLDICTRDGVEAVLFKEDCDEATNAD